MNNTDKKLRTALILISVGGIGGIMIFPLILVVIGGFMIANIIQEIKNEKSYVEVKETEIKRLQEKVTEENFVSLQNQISDAEATLNARRLEAQKTAEKEAAKTKKYAYLYKSIKAYIEIFRASEPTPSELRQIEQTIADLEIEDLMNPTTEIRIHSMDIKDLRSQNKQINHDIEATFQSYEKRYTTKGNLAIYRLMVVALRSELQNVLYSMRFGKLEDASAQINEICDKYLQIAAEGNQSIAGTITRFVTETRSLFLDAVTTEYEYYIRKERAKEEQKALREQMRQEAEERRRLEQEQKKIEAEESKYTAEIDKLRDQLEAAEDEKRIQIEARIGELEEQMVAVNEKKEMIAKLQNGKAGYVYVISNLGSFGERVFKIGMTRRSDPQGRIDELGSASVPFKFDVHSFIFSDDAPALETAIHHRLHEKRVNRVNLRKEFFDISLDELEALVNELEPTAEFNRTMAAEEYHQSMSMSAPLGDILDTDWDDEET